MSSAEGTVAPARHARTASEAIAESIRGQIATEAIRPGDALPPEEALGELYGVARPTIREALRILESDGLVSIHRGINGGARVREPDVETLARRAGLHLQLKGTDLSDLIEAQQLMLPGAVALAARRRSAAELAALTECVDAIEACERIDDYADLAADFLRMLLQGSGNQTLSLFSELVDTLLHRELRAHLHFETEEETRTFLAWCVAQYRRVVALIEAGDAEMAEAFWREHLRLTIPPRGEVTSLQIYRPWRATAPAGPRVRGRATPALRAVRRRSSAS